MSKIFKKLIRKHGTQNLNRFLDNLYKKFFCGYAIKSYSQQGEDIILKTFLHNKNQGFYVDIGAHHPKRFSNTYNFYKKGWNGLNIDPRPNMKKLFQKARKRDINLELGISDKSGKVDFYIFQEEALNTFDKKTAQILLTKGHILQKKTKVQVETLENILKKHTQNKQIDFMNIDVEGHETKVLKSNNWKKYRPNILLVEIHDLVLDDLKSPVHLYLKKQEYSLIAKTPFTSFYKDNLN